MTVGGQRHAPAALPPGKTPYPLQRRVGGPQGRSGEVWKIPLPPGFDPRNVQSLYRLRYAGPQYMDIGHVYLLCTEQNITKITVNMNKCASFTHLSIHNYDKLVNYKYKSNQGISDTTTDITVKRNKCGSTHIATFLLAVTHHSNATSLLPVLLSLQTPVSAHNSKPCAVTHHST